MNKNTDLLGHLENVHEAYIDLVDKIPTEDKLIMSHEEIEKRGLEPWEISEIVQNALNIFPDNLNEHMARAFDIIYDAISEALERSRK